MATGCTPGYPSKSGNAPTPSVPGIGEEEFPDGTCLRALAVPRRPFTPSPPDGHMAGTSGMVRLSATLAPSPLSLPLLCPWMGIERNL
jgi:hypothetical protein